MSDLPSRRLFGWLSAFAMISARVADSWSCGRPSCSCAGLRG